MQTWTQVFTHVRRGCVIQRCQNENPRWELRSGDVNDVMHQKRGQRIWGIWEKAVSWVPASERESWDSDLGEAWRLCALQAPRVGWVDSWRCKSSQHRKIVCVSLSSCQKTFKLKNVNKSFVPEPILWMSCISDSLCLFHTSIHYGYVTVAPDRVLSMSQIGLNCVLMLNWIVWNRTVFDILSCILMQNWIVWNRIVLTFNCV